MSFSRVLSIILECNENLYIGSPFPLLPVHPGQQCGVVLAWKGLLEEAGDVSGLMPQGTTQLCTERPQTAKVSKCSTGLF